MEQKLIERIKQYGEKEYEDEEFYRIWLNGLNGVCNINGHTDILSAVACKDLDGNDTLSIQVNTPDDKSTLFVGLEELPEPAVKLVVGEMLNQLFPEN